MRPAGYLTLGQADFPRRVTESRGWVRFTLYAALVRRLHVVRSSLRGRRFKFAKTARLGQNALLPHLQELHFTASRDGPGPLSLDQTCTHLFHPGLRSFRVEGPPEMLWVGLDQAQTTLVLTSATRGALTRLDLFPSAGGPELEGALELALPSLGNLVELGLGCKALTDRVLAAIGGLADLHTLSLLDHPEAVNPLANVRAPLGSFPSLRTLQVKQVTAGRLNQLLAIGVLVLGLSTVEFELSSAPDAVDAAMGELIFALSHHAYRIQTLRLNVPRRADGETYGIRSASIRPLYTMPVLRELAVSGVKFVDHEDCEPLNRGLRWQKLERLSWRDQCASLQDLEAFSRFHTLQVLGVSLRGLQVPEALPARDEFEPTAMRRTRLESDFALSHLSVAEVDRFTQ